MARISRDKVIWRRYRDGVVRHAIQPIPRSGLTGPEFGAVCGEGFAGSELAWIDDLDARECRTCARLVEPAPAQEN